MKKIILMILVAMATVSVSAQKFGVKAGANISSYYGSDAKDLDSRIGFQVGGLYELPVSGDFFIQPEALLTLNGAAKSVTGASFSINPLYLQVPVKALYKLAAGPGKVTIAAGPYLAIGIAGKETYKIDGQSESSMSIFTKENGASEAILNSFDLGLSSAVGYELSSGLFFNLESTLGFLNVSKDSNMKNSSVSLVAGFKF